MLKTLAELDARFNGDELVVRFRPTELKTLDLLNRAREAGLEVEDFSTPEPSLEDLFLGLTSRRGAGADAWGRSAGFPREGPPLPRPAVAGKMASLRRP